MNSGVGLTLSTFKDWAVSVVMPVSVLYCVVVRSAVLSVVIVLRWAVGKVHFFVCVLCCCVALRFYVRCDVLLRCYIVFVVLTVLLCEDMLYCVYISVLAI